MMRDTASRRLQAALQRLRGDGPGTTLVRGAGGAFVVKVLATAIGLVLQIFLTRTLGKVVFGDYNYVLSWINLLVLLSVLGLDMATVRFVAAYRGQAAWGLLRGFLRRSAQLGLLLSVATALLFAAGVWLLRRWIDPGLARLFWLGCPLLPLITLVQIYAARLQGFKRATHAQVPLSVFRPLAIVAGLAVALFGFGMPRSAALALLINLGATVAALGVAVAMVRPAVPPETRTAACAMRTREWLVVSMPMFAIEAFQRLLTSTDVLMVGGILDTTASGIYFIASQVSTLIAFGVIAVNLILPAMVSELHAQGRREEMQRVISLAARGVLAFGLPLALAIVVAGPWLLAIFGKDFTVGYPVLVVLCAGQVANVLAGSVGYIMIMTGHQNQAMLVIGSSALLNVALNALFIPWFGIVGAAVATMLSTAFRSIALFFYVRGRLKINPTAFDCLSPRELRTARDG